MTGTVPTRARAQYTPRPVGSATTAGRGTAVIVGGGLAGLLAARVLCKHVEHVVIVERDHYPAEPAWRPGLPQGRHAHLLLEAGHRGLEQLLPGIRAQLIDAGATEIVIGSDLRWRNAVDWMAPHTSGLSLLSVGRPLLDHLVRARILTEPNISIIEGTKVVGLLTTGRTVTGVQTREPGHAAIGELPADLVVDASGRDTDTDRWLAELGVPLTPVLTVDAGCVYSSRRIHLPANVTANLGYRALYVQTSPNQPFTGSMLPVENGEFIVSLGAMNGGRPGRREAGFEALLNLLPDSTLQTIVAQADSASPVAWLPAGPSVRRDIRQDPDGLIRIGDAGPAKLNPTHGQGMTCAILAVLALDEATVRHDGIGPTAQRAARRAAMTRTGPAWLMSTSEDARLPETRGAPHGPLIRAAHRYLDRVSLRATQRPQVSAAYTSVMSMTAPPVALVRPRVAVPALLGSGGGGPR